MSYRYTRQYKAGDKGVRHQDLNYLLDKIDAMDKRSKMDAKKTAPFEIQRYAQDDIVVNGGIWWRNKVYVRNLPNTALKNGTWDDLFDSPTVLIDLSYNWQTAGSSLGPDYNGVKFIVAQLSNDAETSNLPWAGNWSAMTQLGSPALEPNKYHIQYYDTVDLETKFSGIGTIMDNTRKIIGAVKCGTDSVVSIYNFMDQDIDDCQQISTWDLFDVADNNGTIGLYLIAGSLEHHVQAGHTVSTAQGQAVRYTHDIIRADLVQGAKNYVVGIYYPCGSDGQGSSIFDVVVVTSAADTLSNDTSFRQTIWEIDYTGARIGKCIKKIDENLKYFEYAADLEWDRNAAATLEWHAPNTLSTGNLSGCGYHTIFTAGPCPT